MDYEYSACSNDLNVISATVSRAGDSTVITIAALCVVKAMGQPF